MLWSPFARLWLDTKFVYQKHEERAKVWHCLMVASLVRMGADNNLDSGYTDTDTDTLLKIQATNVQESMTIDNTMTQWYALYWVVTH